MTRLRQSLRALAVLLGPGLVMAAEKPGRATGPIFPYPIHKTVLDNGLTVLSVPFDSPGIIAYYTIVRTGSRNEVEKGLSGFAHFFEHMMFRGTDAYPQEKYNDVAQGAGGGFQRVHQRRLDVLSHDDPGLGAGHGGRARVGPVPQPQVRRARVPEGSAGGAGRVQQERIVAVPEAERGDAGHRLYDSYLQAHDDRLPRRHPGHAQPVRLQQGLLRPLVPAGELHDHRGWGREARRARFAGQAVLWRLEAGHDRRDHPGRAAPDRAAVVAGDVAAAHAADALPGLSHPVGRSVRPRHRRAGRAGPGRLRRDQPALPAARAQGAEGRGAPGRGRGEARCGPVHDRGAGAEARRPGRGPPTDHRGPGRGGGETRSIPRGSTRSSRICATSSPARSTAPTTWPTRSARPWRSRARPDAINALYDAYDRLTPADLRRVAARYFRPANETAIILETEKPK